MIWILVLAPRPVSVIGAHIERLLRNPTGRTSGDARRRAVLRQTEIVSCVVPHAGEAGRIARVVKSTGSSLRQHEGAGERRVGDAAGEPLVIKAISGARSKIAVGDCCVTVSRLQ